MDGSYTEHAVLGKTEHLLRGLYRVFQDVGVVFSAALSSSPNSTLSRWIQRLSATF